ncbi:hypothetical protein PO878_07800 [Iamia majanohamensis]|uniref:Uncharacterized protein n=1 Tax=Iamia majanohamensis TaxID=467976 RepID=A0AAF0BSN9_9ACTN|nr:hypothetical protein [Iamia majanohamensis]WCO68631.1 hypothetical protein PO878_07800 [Iamia majanohamensis]
MTAGAPALRSRADRGWRLAGLLGLMLVTFVCLPLGARDAAGVSSVLPALRPVALAQPAGSLASRPADAASHEAPRAPRSPRPVAPSVVVALAGVALAVLAVVARRRAADDDVPRVPAASASASRAPPAVC